MLNLNTTYTCLISFDMRKVWGVSRSLVFYIEQRKKTLYTDQVQKKEIGTRQYKWIRAS